MQRRLSIILSTSISLALFYGAGPAAAQEYEVYRGLLHGHTSLSDGSEMPDDAYRSAREAGLDFFAVTEHNHRDAAGNDGVFLTPDGYESLKRSAANHNVDGEFVAIFGQEVSTISKGNHVNVFNSDNIVDIASGDFRDLYERYLRDHDEVPFIQFNHPGIRKDQNPRTEANERNNDYGIGQYNLDYRQLVAASGHYVGLIELIVGPAFSDRMDFAHHNGKHEHDYLFYLNEGFRLGPSAGQDNHHPNWGRSTEARTGVWATELTREGIFEGLRSHRTFASEDRNVGVSFRTGDTWMGDTAAVGADDPLEFVVSISDSDEPDASYNIAVFEDGAVGGDLAQIVDIIEVSGDSTTTFSRTPEAGSYYLLRVSQTSSVEDDTDDIWTAPIWIASAIGDDRGVEHSESDRIDWEEAFDHIGRTVTVEGRIVDSFMTDEVLFLNFSTDFRETLTLVVFADDFAAFGGGEALEQRLLGKTITASGEISTYRNRVQMIINNPSQIGVVP